MGAGLEHGATLRLGRIRILLACFMVALVLSGMTAFALDTELGLLSEMLGIDAAAPPSSYTGLRFWIATVAHGLHETNRHYPFLAYGTDWLAFGHLVIAVFFIGPWIDPVHNRWVIDAGIIACVGVIPMALIAGAIRSIPFYWRLIDCSFGVFGIVPLWLVRQEIQLIAVRGCAEGMSNRT